MRKREVINKLMGVVCVVAAAVFAHIETAYFGHNFFPATMMEWWCDATASLLAFTGLYLILSLPTPNTP